METQNWYQASNEVAWCIILMESTSPECLAGFFISTLLCSEEILFARKVSAIDLDFLHVTSTLKQHNTTQCLQMIKASGTSHMFEEYFGLNDTTKIWEYLSEEEYNRLRPVIGKVLPTIAIATITKDKHTKPERAKYHNVVLGNLNHCDWIKSQVFVSAMSYLDLCLQIIMQAW